MDSKDKLEYKKAWARAKRLANPEAARAADKVRRERYKEQRKAYQAIWYQKNKDYHRLYASTHKEQRREAYKRWRLAHPQDARDATKRWRKANWPKVLASLQRRRARRAGAQGTATLVQIKARYDFYGGKCWICLNAEATCMDHVIALCNGGSNWPSNLRPACKRCNSMKGAVEMRGRISSSKIKGRDFGLQR